MIGHNEERSRKVDAVLGQLVQMKIMAGMIIKSMERLHAAGYLFTRIEKIQMLERLMESDIQRVIQEDWERLVLNAMPGKWADHPPTIEETKQWRATWEMKQL